MNRRTTFSERVLFGAVAIAGLLAIIFHLCDKIHFSLQ